MVWSPCCPRDSQDASPTLQFKSISPSVLRLLYGPTLTSIHDYWKNHCFDYMDLCWQSNVSAFQYYYYWIVIILSYYKLNYIKLLLYSAFSSVAQSCLTLCDPMNRSTPGLPIYHQLLEFTQTHVHWVSDAIQPSHPLSSTSPPAPNPSQHQTLFQWVKSSHEVAKVLEF